MKFFWTLCLLIWLQSCDQSPLCSPWWRNSSCVARLWSSGQAFSADPQPALEDYEKHGKDKKEAMANMLRLAKLYNRVAIRFLQGPGDEAWRLSRLSLSLWKRRCRWPRSSSPSGTPVVKIQSVICQKRLIVSPSSMPRLWGRRRPDAWWYDSSCLI